MIAIKLMTAAPPEIPKMKGSASGLRNNVCMSAPARASNPPVMKAQIVRGRRSVKTMVCSNECGLNNESIHCDQLACVLPKLMDSSMLSKLVSKRSDQMRR